MKYKNCNEILRNTKDPVAFVLGCHVTGLGVMRNLGRKEIPVIGLDPNPLQVGKFSRYCIGIKSPNPGYSEERYVEFLLNLGKKLSQKGVLFPTTDMYLLEILKNRKKLEKYYRFTMSEWPSSCKLINKRIFYETLKKYGIEHPVSYFPNDISDVFKIGKEIEYPCYVKPIYSCYFKKAFQIKAFIAHSSQDLIKYYKKSISINNDAIIQECISSEKKETYCLNAYFNRKFEAKGVFISRRIREWPPECGCSSLIEKGSYYKFLNIVYPLIRKIKYYGIIDAEFKKDKRDGEFKLIEINARPWMQITLPARDGVDHSYMAYMDSIGKEINVEMQNTGYIKWISSIDDLSASIMEALNNELSFQQWIDSLRGKKVYAFYAKDDPLPFFVKNVKSVFRLIPYITNIIMNKTVSL
ncbi:MAG: hypothetical protein KAW45_00620 [Thermoplasmatales archaeon]|nr:hypothetical protein [Thermoplasmatales archaeon]